MDKQNQEQLHSTRSGIPLGTLPRAGESRPEGDGAPGPSGQKDAPKGKRFLPRLVIFLVTLAMVLGAVAAVVFRDSLNLDSIRRWFHYRSLSLSDSGRAESFPYGGSLTDTFAVLDGDLLVCSPNTISLFSGSGTQYVSQR